jgi:hypothetical protein
MLEGFICPDGQRIKTVSCLAQCRMDRRCLTLPTLHSVAWQREWKGKPSTTQCLSGTRCEMLKITKPYYIDPKDRSFALLGSRHHWKLEAVAKKLAVLPEETLEDEDTKGTFDLLEPDGVDTYGLSDYKTAGSFKVARAMGLVSRKVKHPTEVYKSSGKWGKAGDPKMIDEWYIDESKIDMWDWEMQLNNYRMKVEACGFPIAWMQIQATVRDGNTRSARDNGIFENIYLIPVKRMDDEVVEEYFNRKARALIKAIDTGFAPICEESERWGNTKCLRYCEVAEFCDHGMSLKENK